jgi:hypothetical protein
MLLPFEFDFTKPDYTKVWEWRVALLTKLRANPGSFEVFKDYYKRNPAAFMSHWSSTFDPRNADIGLPTSFPFVLFDKQEEWCDWLLERWRSREPGLIEKSRDMGMSWLCVGMACTLCLFNKGITIGFGSRKEEYVDKLGDPKSLFWKARMFMATLPIEFRGGWDIKIHAPHMRILFPDSGSSITGESGDGIGRGDRKSIYFVDEAAHLERPALVEASLSATTNCRIDLSSAAGMANPFAQKVHSGKHKVFTFHWRDDPRKDQAWYDKQINDLDPVTLAQEVDINYSASVEGVVIPQMWISAAIDACSKLGIVPTGATTGALDIADEGIDLNAFGAKKGVHLFQMKSWSGKGGDTLLTTEKAFMLSEEFDVDMFQYDSDGIGAGIRGDIRLINARRKSQNIREIKALPYRGSGEVIDPEKPAIGGDKERTPRLNKDYYKNRKAQAWWSLRRRFEYTWRAVTKLNLNEKIDYDNIISIDSKLPELPKLLMELPQATYTITTEGKILIDKTPDNTRSPNLADAVVMLYSPVKRSVGLFS